MNDEGTMRLAIAKAREGIAAGQLPVAAAAAELAAKGRSPLKVEGGLLRDECAALFALWKQSGLSEAY
jgi:hypothetical protein